MIFKKIEHHHFVFAAFMAIIIFFFAAVIVQGYGTTNPLSFGHSAGELAGGTLGAGDYTFPQNLFVNGKVGVGTTSPILDVYGDASDQLCSLIFF